MAADSVFDHLLELSQLAVYKQLIYLFITDTTIMRYVLYRLESDKQFGLYAAQIFGIIQ